jgi:hypothetical protein
VNLSLAERLHAAFAESSEWTDAPGFMEWPDGGAAWHTLAAEREKFLEAPETLAPYDHPLRTPVSPRFHGDIEIKETLPTALHIRPRVAGDLSIPQFALGGEAYNLAVQAKIHGVSVKMLEDRIDVVDVEMGMYLLAEATGVSESSAISTRAAELMPEVPDEIIESCNWDLVAYAMFVVDQGDRAVVHCRTPGLGQITVGPYKSRHKRIERDTARDSNAWEARLATLADMSGKTITDMKAARVEDIVRAWSAFEVLKKNASEMSLLAFLSRPSSTSMAGGLATSTSGPTPN